MSVLMAFDPGNYRYVRGGAQYSSAVVANPGWEIERARFARPVPLAEGFARIEAHLASIGRPTTALCSNELRSPEALTEEAFQAFNRAYAQPMQRWGLINDGLGAAGRCNLSPEIGGLSGPSFYAFNYTVPSSSRAPSFMVSGIPECEARPNYRETIVRLGETSPDALRDKLIYILDVVEKDLALMNVTWADVLDTHLYTVHDLHHTMMDEFGRRGALAGEFRWHFARPPVHDVEIEVDARAVRREVVLPA